MSTAKTANAGTLLYFPLRARAEHLRMMMRHAEIMYEDSIVTFDTWPDLQGTMPANTAGKRQLPVLWLADGTMMCETADIAAYLASLAPFHLHPDAPGAKEMFEQCNNRPLSLAMPLTNWFDAEESNKRLPAFLEEAIPLLKEFEAKLGEQAFFYGPDGPHYGEFGLWHVVNLVHGLHPDALDDLGALTAWADRIAALPRVYPYLAERPKAMSGNVGRPGSRIATTPLDGGASASADQLVTDFIKEEGEDEGV